MKQARDLSYKAGESSIAPSVLNFLFTIRVREEGGRWVPQTVSIPCYPALHDWHREKQDARSHKTL